MDLIFKPEKVKKNNLALLLLLCAMVFSWSLKSQKNDSTYLLKGVEIKSLKNDNSRTNYLNEIYTANALQFQLSDLYIRNYGVGQLSTFSVRGFGPENVAILWEGIPVNSPMNGLLDLNQVPNSLLQNIEYSADENRLSSGGVLNLSNTKSNTNTVAFSSTSYLSELFSHKLDGQIHFKKSRFSFNNQITHGRNFYEYINSTNVRDRLNHNAVKQINTQFFYSYSLTEKLNFNSGFWYQNQDRDIPVSAFYPVETQSLIDRNWRSFIGLSNDNLDVKLAYMNESQKYNDRSPFFPSESIHKVASWKGTVNYHKTISKDWDFKYRLYPSHYNIESTSLNDSSINIQEAIQQIDLKYKATDKVVLAGGLKSQINTNFNNFLLPYVSISYLINDKWSATLIGDINERNPTMNDLYFNFFGNINLRPETNYQIRNTWKYRNSNTIDKIAFSLESYYIKSVDKINYVPDSGFRVFNIDETRSFGLNSNFEWVHKVNRNNSLRTIWSFNYIDTKDKNDKALAYVPNFKTIFGLNWIHRNYEFLMQNNYTSKRFANTANSTSLNPYFLTNIKATYKHHMKSNQYQFSIGIDNLWNENFQEIQGSFMPLRNYYLNFTAILR